MIVNYNIISDKFLAAILNVFKVLVKLVIFGHSRVNNSKANKIKKISF